MICDTNTIAVAPTSHNGRMRPSSGGDKSPERSPEEELAWSMMEQAIDDLATLCRWGLITPSGRCMPWPRLKRLHWTGCVVESAYVKVANMNGPNDHIALKQFFHDQTQAQLWADLIGMSLPMADVWKMTLKHNCGRQP
jgi:hypothetical protein